MVIGLINIQRIVSINEYNQMEEQERDISINKSEVTSDTHVITKLN